MTDSPDKSGNNNRHFGPKDMIKSLKYIFSGIRHEIGNPINSIKMTVSVLKENIDRFPREKILEYIDRVLTETDRVEYLLKSLKNFSTFENLFLSDVDLPEFMKKFLAQVTPGVGEKGIHLKYHVPPDLGKIHTDARALQQVLQNILENAIDALEGTTNPVISIDVAKIPGERRFIITDNGRGISPAHNEEIFKPFFSTRPRRTGLGLSIVQTILTRMNGTIKVHSEVESGTSIIFYIPEEYHETV